MTHCQECGAELTQDERHYYQGRCEICESAWHNRIAAWMAGEPDEEFDAAFTPKPKVLQ